MTDHDNTSDSASSITRLRSAVPLPRSHTAVAAVAMLMTMVVPVAAQQGGGGSGGAKGICAIGAAESVLELAFLIMVGSIAAFGIFKFGGGIAKWLMGGSKGSAALRLSLIAAAGGIFLALGFEDILTWFAGKASSGSGSSSGLASIGLKCMLPG